MLLSLFIFMRIHIFSFLSKILITGVNFKRQNHQVHWVDLQEYLGRTECLIKCIIMLRILNEWNMVRWILLTTLMVLQSAQVMVSLTFYWSNMWETGVQWLIWTPRVQILQFARLDFATICYVNFQILKSGQHLKVQKPRK